MMKEVLGSTEQYSGYRYDVGSFRDQTRYAAQQDDAQLQDFFSRPLKIQEYLWGTETEFFEQFNPWQDFFENPRVINRLSNYNLMRADLHVRFLITGNGFHYGRVLCSYNPLGPADEFASSRALIPQDTIQESQRPHVYLDPTASQGGDIKCPFFWYNDALNIPNQDWRQMGDVTMRSLGTLEHANAAIDQVTISVLAWAENVEMSIPTSAEPGSIVPQAGDEYGQSPVSTPASVVARIAGKLVDIPVIGLYAKATELAASTVAAVARMFGYSRPRIIEDIIPYIPRFGGNLASTNAGDNSLSLAVDNKQELTVDPRVVGLRSVDEMDIQSIACRESYLTFFPWQRTDTPETTLFSIRVSPVLWDQDPDGGIALLPCALATLPFAYWRCKMRYRFQIVASQYHKGRLRIAWDPHGFATNEFNVNYNHIIDIAEEKDFSIEIGWGSDEHFKLTASVAGATVPFATSLLGDAGNPTTNGILRVLVMNELTVPNSDIPNAARVNVFASACDLEVASPDSTTMNNLQWFPEPTGGAITESEAVRVPQAGVDVGVGDGELTTEPSKPVQDQAIRTMGADLEVTDPTFHVYFGEVITSFRQMLKRFVFTDAWRTPTTNVNAIIQEFTTSLPLYPGYAPDAIHSSDGGANYNFVNTSLISWLLPVYTGWKGSIRWKAVVKGNPGAQPRGLLSISRFLPSVGYSFTTLLLPTAGAGNALIASTMKTAYKDSYKGHQITPAIANPTLEVEVPFYSGQRFGNTRDKELLTLTTTQAGHVLWSLESYATGAGTTYETVNKYVATGEDFSFYFFNSIPYMYVVTEPSPT